MLQTARASVALVLACCVGSAAAFVPARLLAAPLGLRAGARAQPHAQRAPLRLAMQEERNAEAQRRAPGLRAAAGLAPLLPALAVVLVPGVVGAEPPEWLEDTRSSLDIGLAVFSLLFFLRIPLTWYPQMDLKKLPQAVVAIPTEPFCAVVRKVTPPLFGVDISPIVLYAILSFIREIFLGQQGVLTMMAEQ